MEVRAHQPPAPSPVRLAAVLAVAVTAGVLDQVAKWAASAALSPGTPVWLVPDFLGLELKTNPNGAFGLFASFPDALRLPVLLALGVLAVTAVTLFSLRTLGFTTGVSVALGLLLGGAVSNLGDRLVRGEVVDFINLHLGGPRHWPTFNLADVGITAGSVLLVMTLLRTWVRQRRESEYTES